VGERINVWLSPFNVGDLAGLQSQKSWV